jgi:ubiquinone/menaquinone biosynthesis C-methylase UbiE
MYPYASNVIRADLTDISLQENSVDLVICNHVLEHVPDDALAMRELHRVLKPGGIAILQVPISTKLKLTDEDHRITSPEQREKRFGQYDHVRLYGSDYTDRLVAAGFSVQTFDPLLTWGAQFIEANRLNPRERLFACRK